MLLKVKLSTFIQSFLLSLSDVCYSVGGILMVLVGPNRDLTCFKLPQLILTVDLASFASRGHLAMSNF